MSGERRKTRNYIFRKINLQLLMFHHSSFSVSKGKGNPNNEEFKDAVEALYSLSYAIRMMPKKGYTPEGYFEYTVFPLEGIWDLEEEYSGS